MVVLRLLPAGVVVECFLTESVVDLATRCEIIMFLRSIFSLFIVRVQSADALEFDCFKSHQLLSRVKPCSYRAAPVAFQCSSRAVPVNVGPTPPLPSPDPVVTFIYTFIS